MRALDLAGKKFSRLTVLERVYGKPGVSKWLCKCDCGATCIVTGYYIKSGHTKSCGCYNNEILGTLSVKHRQSNSIEHKTWMRMRERCNNENGKKYADYGGRGIKVCDRWNDFSNFLEDMGKRPEGTSIDRIDVDGDYEPRNCRWADLATQATNKRRTIFITHDGITDSAAGWSLKLGIGVHLIYKRYRLGCRDPEQLLKKSRNTKEIR